jgi:tRNA (guanine10-N2)-methyltransferase
VRENQILTEMRCLVQLYEDWVDFRLPELKALLQMHGLSWDEVVMSDTATDETAPVEERHFYVLDLPNEDLIKTLCSRSVLVKAVYELWSSGTDLQSLITATQQLDNTFTGPYLESEESWAVSVNTFGRVLSMEQKQDCRLHFKFLDFRGPVNVAHPQMEMCVTLDYTKYRHHTAATVIPASEGGLIREVRTDVPAYFGRLIARGGMKEILKVHDLKKRLYLGPTSLDDSLALILANISGVQKGMLAYDPFVGTASILVALAQLGCVCMGSDIDPRVLRGEMHAGTTSGDEATNSPPPIPTTTTSTTDGTPSAGWKGKGGVAEATAKRSSKHNAAKRNIFANFKAYGLPLPELVRMDNHMFDRHITLKTVAAGSAGDEPAGTKRRG